MFSSNRKIMNRNSIRLYATSFSQKHVTSNRNPTTENGKRRSILQDLYPWKTKAQFVEHLASCVIYNNDGLLAINKPYGVPLRQMEQTTAGPNESLFALEEALDGLANIFKTDKLLPAKITERFVSGVSLFITCDTVREKIDFSSRVNHSEKILSSKYLAVTLYEPKPASIKETVGVGFITHPSLPGRLPTILKEYSKRQVKANVVREFDVAYKKLSSSELCSLLEVDTHSNKNHFLRFYLAHHLSPVLGDNLYGNRVQDVYGVKLPLGPIHADSLSTFQKIPKKVLDLLRVPECSLVPNCLHHKQLTLARFGGGKDSLIIKAEPPPYFQYIINQLNLK